MNRTFHNPINHTFASYGDDIKSKHESPEKLPYPSFPGFFENGDIKKFGKKVYFKAKMSNQEIIQEQMKQIHDRMENKRMELLKTKQFEADLVDSATRKVSA